MVTTLALSSSGRSHSRPWGKCDDVVRVSKKMTHQYIKITRTTKGPRGYLRPGQIVLVSRHQANGYLARCEAVPHVESVQRKGGARPDQAMPPEKKAKAAGAASFTTLDEWRGLSWKAARKAADEIYGQSPKSWDGLMSFLAGQGLAWE